jgi:hypothetical protein
VPLEYSIAHLICAFACGRERRWLAGPVQLSIVYLPVRRILSPMVLLFRKDLARKTELLVLRRENTVLRRHAGRCGTNQPTGVWFNRAHAADTSQALGQVADRVFSLLISWQVRGSPERGSMRRRARAAGWALSPWQW